MLRRGFCLLVLILTCWLVSVSEAEAAICKNIAGKQVCILKLKRSAKYYWQYRVKLRIDRGKKITRVYNCRDRYYTQPDRLPVDYLEDDPLAKSVCTLYEKYQQSISPTPLYLTEDS